MYKSKSAKDTRAPQLCSKIRLQADPHNSHTLLANYSTTLCSDVRTHRQRVPLHASKTWQPKAMSMLGWREVFAAGTDAYLDLENALVGNHKGSRKKEMLEIRKCWNARQAYHDQYRNSVQHQSSRTQSWTWRSVLRSSRIVLRHESYLRGWRICPDKKWKHCAVAVCCT